MTTVTQPQTGIWQEPKFLILLSSAFFAAFGAKIYSLALPLLVYELTASSEWMGWMRAVEYLPNLLLALFIGVWVDRVNRKHWSQAMLIGQCLCLLIAYTAVEWLAEPLWALFPAAFMMMAFDYGYHNARLGMMKTALPQALQNTATARFSTMYSFLETVGPVLSGVLLLMAAIHQVFLLLIVLYLIAFVQLHRMPFTPAAPVTHPPVLTALKEGWQALSADKTMCLITVAVVVINTTGAVFHVQAIYFAKATLMMTNLEVSYLIAASGIGGILGGLVADKIRKRIGLGLLLILSIAFESVGFALPALLPSAPVLALSFFLISSIGLMSSICIWSYRQEAFSDTLLGRVAGITGSLFKLGMPFGLAASGYLVVTLGTESLFLLCGIIQFITALLLCLTRVRHTL
ncbi:MFS transporter [Photobacterium sp. CAU 1568]|uniref:MFS transporter n=1 Tax=Photobacterium arenosum TaxID=2774143 RepID=A0ABR9BIY1_9GAMM|nr:MFS transporter [Photobacterium arenosum]MBD8512522.1 MFS transporter [Photobacterium arenosum]